MYITASKLEKELKLLSGKIFEQKLTKPVFLPFQVLHGIHSSNGRFSEQQHCNLVICSGVCRQRPFHLRRTLFRGKTWQEITADIKLLR